jgi:integrase
MTQREKLTPAVARALPPGGVLRDHEVKGLILRCYETGAKSWLLRYFTRSGVERKPKLGDFPEMSLSVARETAKALKKRVSEGEDPGAEWQKSREELTVEDLCDKYVKEWAARRVRQKKMSQSSLDQHQQLIDAQIKPGLGRLRLSEVDVGVVDKFLEKVFNREFVDPEKCEQMAGDTSHWTARHTRSLVSKLFGLAKSYWKIEVANPTVGAVSYVRIKRKRHATHTELPAIAAALKSLAEEKGQPLRAACIWTMFLTGGRVSEILKALTDNYVQKAVLQDGKVVGKRWVLSYDEHKTVHHIGAKDIPVPAVAVRLIEQYAPVKRGARLFGDVALRTIEQTWDDVRKAAGCPDLKLLDARRTFASFALTSGKTLEQVGELLFHTDSSTTKGYSYLLEEARAAAATDTADSIARAAGLEV